MNIPNKCLANATGHVWHRAQVGPTGTKKNWFVRVDYCGWCGWFRPVAGDNLSYKQRDWIERYNRGITQRIKQSDAGS